MSSNAASLKQTAPVPDAVRPPLTFRQELRYRRLDGAFYTSMPAEGVTTDPVLVHASPEAAALIGLEPADFAHPDFAPIFSGTMPMSGFQPLAMVYSGHQFGVWAGQLGDGRALTIGQVLNPAGAIWDVQLKGAGRTPYSRFGDGRAVLRSSIREYLCSEAMAALGVPTTRALCVVATRRAVMRETREPGAVVTRLMRSNIRFGHFEHFHHGGQPARVRELADFVIAEHHPELAGDYGAWFDLVVTRTAELIARWQAIGFAHGVMNTDNMSILGDTLDYGPFGFLDAFDPGFICNHSDHGGRYAFDQQPGVAVWNLQALAVALQGLIAWERLATGLKLFVPRFSQTYSALLKAKTGLSASSEETDAALVSELLALMKRAGADYTRSFRLLSATFDNPGRAAWTALFDDASRPEAFAWLDRWQARLGALGADEAATIAALNAANPKFVLRNWVAETAIRAVEDDGDIATLERIFRLVTNPFEEHAPQENAFAQPPEGEMRHLEVSCSS